MSLSATYCMQVDSHFPSSAGHAASDAEGFWSSLAILLAHDSWPQTSILKSFSYGHFSSHSSLGLYYCLGLLSPTYSTKYQSCWTPNSWMWPTHPTHPDPSVEPFFLQALSFSLESSANLVRRQLISSHQDCWGKYDIKPAQILSPEDHHLCLATKRI